MESRFSSIRRIVRLHVNWLTVKLLGKELLSEEDLTELKKYGKLSLGDEISFIERAFALGRASAVLKQADYEGLTLDSLSRFEKKKYSSAEKLAVREAKFHANKYLHTIAEEVVAASSDAVSEASEKLVNDVLRVMADEVSAAVAEKKSSKELSSKLSSILNRGFKKDWTKFATTELHRAKIRGTAMAIANKVDIYSKSDGIESDVSVVPNKGACKDCLNLYLDNDRNPKVFKLKAMLEKGTNIGAKHTRNKQGIHEHWKAVMPPAHPNCYCTLVYVPPGMMWYEGKLQVSDSVKYNEHITKAVDQGSMSSTIKPPGPKSTQGPKIPKTRSLPGLPAPNNQPGPGPGSGGGDGDGGLPEGMVKCPFGGGKACIEHGGESGGKTHEINGEEMQRHAAYMQGDSTKADQLPPEELAAKIMATKDWKAEDHPLSVTMNHLEHGEILAAKPLGEESGINKTSLKCDIDGNGSALVKASISTEVNEVGNEIASYKLFTLFGSKLCPPTGERMHEGVKKSSQYWLGDFSTADEVYETEGRKNYESKGALLNHLIENSKDPDSLVEDLSMMTIMDIVIGNVDRHFGNFMLDADKKSAAAIDHGFVFGIGFNEYKSFVHRGFKGAKRHVKIPPGLRTRFENTTLSDMQKAAGNHAKDWQIGQSYLRMKYALQIDAEEGHLPYDAFGYEKDKITGEPIPVPGRKGANERFEDFAIDFIDKNASNPNSKDYASAFQLREMGVFMKPVRYFGDQEFWRGEGEQFEYEKRIRIEKAANEARLRGEKDFTKEPVERALKSVQDKYGKELDELTKQEKLAKDLRDMAVNNYARARDLDDPLTRQKENIDITDEKAAQLKEDAYKEREAAWEAHRIVYDELQSLKKLVNFKKESALDKAYSMVVPPGQEKEFRRLNSAISRKRDSTERRERVMGHFKAAQSKKNAANIESSKRNQDSMKTAKIEDDG